MPAPVSEGAPPWEARRAIALSWLAYATYYLGRKSLSVAKPALAREYALSTGMLAWIDTAYLLAYACGQVPNGLAVDRWGARRIVAAGMLASAFACVCFGMSAAAWAFALCFAVNGFAQSTGWPGTTKIVADRTKPHDRGRVMGVWSTCYQVGGIAATALATWLLAGWGWRAAFWVPAIVLAVVACLVFWGVRDGGASPQLTAAQPTREQLRNVLRTPALYSYGACYFCIKLIRYSLLFWLPYYLHTGAGFDEIESGYLSTGFEVGGVFGSILVGVASDRVPRARALVAIVSLVALAVAVWVYAAIPSHAALWHFAALASIGALLFGPDALVSGAAAQDAGGPHGAATAVGLVNGVGSAGALLQGALTVGVQQAFGWNGLLYVFSGLAALASLCLLPAWLTRAEPQLQQG